MGILNPSPNNHHIVVKTVSTMCFVRLIITITRRDKSSNDVDEDIEEYKVHLYFVGCLLIDQFTFPVSDRPSASVKSLSKNLHH